MTKTSDFILRALVSAIAIAALVVHKLDANSISSIDAALIVVALLPWLAGIIKSIEITGFGKLELQAKEIAKKQELLQEDVDGLRFVVTGFVTANELVHLEKLARLGNFDYVGASREAVFVKELVRLVELGLIEKLDSSFSIYDIAPSGDLKEYLRITKRGQTYLSIRQQVASRERA